MSLRGGRSIYKLTSYLIIDCGNPMAKLRKAYRIKSGQGLAQVQQASVAADPQVLTGFLSSNAVFRKHSHESKRSKRA